MSRSKGRVKRGVKDRVKSRVKSRVKRGVKIRSQEKDQGHRSNHTIAWVHPVDLRAVALGYRQDHPTLPGRAAAGRRRPALGRADSGRGVPC